MGRIYWAVSAGDRLDIWLHRKTDDKEQKRFVAAIGKSSQRTDAESRSR